MAPGRGNALLTMDQESPRHVGVAIFDNSPAAGPSAASTSSLVPPVPAPISRTRRRPPGVRGPPLGDHGGGGPGQAGTETAGYCILLIDRFHEVHLPIGEHHGGGRPAIAEDIRQRTKHRFDQTNLGRRPGGGSHALPIGRPLGPCAGLIGRHGRRAPRQ